MDYRFGEKIMRRRYVVWVKNIVQLECTLSEKNNEMLQNRSGVKNNVNVEYILR